MEMIYKIQIIFLIFSFLFSVINSIENNSNKNSNNTNMNKTNDLYIYNFGYQERKKVIEKCTLKINTIYFNIPNPNLNYNYMMNHCFILNPKLIKKELKYFINILKFKNQEDIHKIIHNPNQIKSIIKSKINLSNINNIKTIYKCKNLEKLTKTYFYYKTVSIKNNKKEEKKLHKFYIWLKENGVEFEKVDIYQDGPMRGIYALEDISYNENLIYIPDKLLINCDRAEKNLVSIKIRKHYDKLKLDYESVILALYIIEEYYNPQSFWKPYLDILPEDLSNFPIFYNDDEMNLLKGHRMYEKIIKLRNKTKFYYEEIICPEAKGIFQVDYCKIVSYKFFLWALINVKSRAFGFPRKRFEIAAISPLSDLLNHNYDTPALLWRFSGKFRGFIIYSFLNHNQNGELFTQYGLIGNEWLLFNYGFLVEDNPNDEIILRITLPQEDKFYFLKFVLLEKRGIKSSRKMPISIDFESTKTIHFLNLFRFLHYRDDINKFLDIQFDLRNNAKTNEKSNVKNEKKYKNIEKNENKFDNNEKMNENKINSNLNSPLKIDYLHDNVKDTEEYNFNPLLFNAVDVDEEIYMLKKLKDLVISNLESFGTSLQEDKLIYDTNKHLMSFNIKNIFYFRISQKKTLQFFIEFCNKMIFLYKMDYKEFRNYYKFHREELKPFDFYIESSVKYLLSIYKI